MGFANVPQWKRHKAIVSATVPTRIICYRCGIELPISVVPGSIVLSKEDRLFIGDDPRATDCT